MRTTIEDLRQRYPHASDDFLRSNANAGNALDHVFRPIPKETDARPAPAKKTPRKPSNGPLNCRQLQRVAMAHMFSAAGLPIPVPEHRFHPTRKWRFDYAWVKQKLALEVDGGIYVNGGHSRGAARESDYTKDANAIILGWRVLRVSTGQLKDGLAILWVSQIFAAERAAQSNHTVAP